MISVIPSKRNFSTLTHLLNEQENDFNQYVAYVREALQVNAEVVEYVREKCPDRHEKALATMERDNRIFHSRLRHLKRTLNECILFFGSTSRRCYSVEKRSMAAKSYKQEMYEYCLKNFFRFYDTKRDIQNQLKQAQRRWLKMQDQILALEN